VAAAQHPSSDCRTEHVGGIILDMLCHWRCVLDDLAGLRESRLQHSLNTPRAVWNEDVPEPVA